MKFAELESTMNELGVTNLANIARTLQTTPQAVSNWKARDQVPYHVVAKINDLKSNHDSQDIGFNLNSKNLVGKRTVSLSDILIIIAQQIKVILIIPFILVFCTFTYVMFIQTSLYESNSTILLPENKGNMGGFAGLASQIGVSVPQGIETDLSSPSIFPELINSRTFASRIMYESFYSDFYEKEMPLISILTKNSQLSEIDKNIQIDEAINNFKKIVRFENQGSFSVLTVISEYPNFARDLNVVVLEKLQELNRFFKSKKVIEKTNFIENRIKAVEDDLVESEKSLKLFREQNRQIISPALQLEQERFAREVEVQKGIFLTLKQQLELSKIEEVQEASIIQILDEPYVPIHPSNKNLIVNLLLAVIMGTVMGVIIAFFRSYLHNDDIDERKKIRRIKFFIKKKFKDIILDSRVSGIVSMLLVLGLPFYLGHESQNPIFFGRYSLALLLVNISYLIFLFSSLILYIYIKKKRIKN